MNKVLFALTCVGILLGTIATYKVFDLTSQKLAYVESARILNEYKGMTVAREAFQEKTVVWKQNIETLSSEFEKALAEYEKAQATMTAKEIALTKELLTAKRNKWQDYQRAIESQAAEEDQKMTQAVILEINTFITEYGKQHGYLFIFGASDMGNVVYANKAVNLTDDVIKNLNSK